MQRGDTQPHSLPRVQPSERMAWALHDLLGALARSAADQHDAALRLAVYARHAEWLALVHAHPSVTTIPVTIPKRP